MWQVSTVRIMFRNLCYWLFLNSILQYSLQIVAKIVDVFWKGYKILYNIYWVGFICNNGKLQRIACFLQKMGLCAEIFLIFSSFSKKYLSLSFSFATIHKVRQHVLGGRGLSYADIWWHKGVGGLKNNDKFVYSKLRP